MIVICDCEHNEHKTPCVNPARVRIPTAFNTYCICQDCLERDHITKEYQDGLITTI